MKNPVAADVRVYPINPWFRALIWAGPIGVTLFIGDAVLTTPGVFDKARLGITSFVLVFLCALNAATWWFTTRTRLELSAAHVSVYNLGVSVWTRWDNVESIRLERGNEGLITREPMDTSGARRLAVTGGNRVSPGFFLFDELGRQLRRERRFVQLEPFAWYLRHGDLAAQIDRFAPHLNVREKLAPVRGQ